MAGFGSNIHQALADWITGTSMPSPPSSLKLALSAGDPTETGAGLVEPVGAGYIRQTVVLTPQAGEGGGTLLTNMSPVVFGPAVDSVWPTLTHGAILDSAGNIIAFGPLGVNRTAPIGDTISFGPQAFQFLVK